MNVLFIPKNWGNIGIVVTDLINISSSVQSYCNFELLITRIHEIFTLEGFSELMARMITALVVNSWGWFDQYSKATTDFYIAAVTGEILSVMFNF